MIRALEERFASLEDGRSRFVTELDRMSQDQLEFSPAPEAWSPLQVGEHVISAETRSVDVLIRQKGRPNATRTLRQKGIYGLVWLIMKLGIRVKNPTRTNPGGEITLAELTADWAELRKRLRTHLEPLETADLERAGFMHPVSGPLNLDEGLLFLDRHIRHHFEQLKRIQQDPLFPTA